ncbi:MAG: menaquinone biosynthetic enzyme MqnA/MqnD family protein [Aureispira sp.]
MSTINLSAVAYLNTKPFLYGIYQHGLEKSIQINLDIPSVCAQKLRDGRANLGLIPVAAIPQIPNAQIITDYCIGTEGAVKTVCIYSHVPIEEVEMLYLDYHSRTSAALTRYLLANHWKVSPQILDAQAGFETQISHQTAALIIGDRTIGLEEQYPYVYDLGLAWKAHTGLPFVFAAWVSTTDLTDAFLEEFNAALQTGINKRAQVAQMFQSSHPNFSVYDYYHQYINYDLTPAKQKALQLFLQHITPKARAHF